MAATWSPGRYDSGAKPYFPHLRFPGHYWDEETDLFENWHRNYYPFVDRYLSPEPMLQQPGYVAMISRSGVSIPAYSYAYNNPLRFIDPTGLCADCDCSKLKPDGGLMCTCVERPQCGEPKKYPSPEELRRKLDRDPKREPAPRKPKGQCD